MAKPRNPETGKLRWSSIYYSDEQRAVLDAAAEQTGSPVSTLSKALVFKGLYGITLRDILDLTGSEPLKLSTPLGFHYLNAGAKVPGMYLDCRVLGLSSSADPVTGASCLTVELEDPEVTEADEILRQLLPKFRELHWRGGIAHAESKA